MNRRKIIVEAIEGVPLLRISQGLQWSVAIHRDDATTLADALVDAVEGDQS